MLLRQLAFIFGYKKNKGIHMNEPSGDKLNIYTGKLFFILYHFRLLWNIVKKNCKKISLKIYS